MNTRSLLVADDLQISNEIPKNRSLAVQRLGSDLSVLLSCPADLVYVHPLDEQLGRKILTSDSRQKIIDNTLKKHEHALRNFQRPGKLIIKTGWPIEELVKLVGKKSRFEALVLGTRSLKSLERFFLGSTSEEVVRHTQRPVFIMGPEAVKNEFRLSEHKKMHFLVVTDLTKKCRAVETYAVSLAKKTGASLTFFHSLAETMSTAQQFAYASGEALSTFNTIFEDMKKDAENTLSKKVERLKRMGLDCHFYIETENENLVESALQLEHENVQLIFMGHQTHGFVASTVLGSNLRAMVAEAKVPVVVVRS
ncbi:hypothetical protein AZI87_16195 [Bdellovibrio bacteriovorus]|uniref:UspA domain-containing protein n=1 Tax=Bdellovibrio bacteriovorus TaxID=959 RepID=A0A162FYY7_BDEBC|nr:universal stress protein [Bdellovibrio bacteriovorus]KYG62815.1 hypothetical protein AZI87_16195 [Bdellovibrio bacteriovorus]